MSKDFKNGVFAVALGFLAGSILWFGVRYLAGYAYTKIRAKEVTGGSK